MGEKRKGATGSAVAGAGAVGAGVGLAAGGVPGAKSDFTSVFRVKPGEGKGAKKVVSTVRGAVPAAKAVPGGILGFRTHAHEGGTIGFQMKAAEHARRSATDNKDAFYRGHNAGKIPAEQRILRGMKTSRKASHALLLGGAAATTYGAGHAKGREVSKNDKHAANYNGALVGVGATGAAVSHGGAKYLDSHKKKYAESASRNVDEAGKLIPALAGRQGKKMTLKEMHRFKTKTGKDPMTHGPKTMYPKVSDGEPGKNPKLLQGVSRSTAEKAGRLRGQAAQERHFAEVFGNTAKVTRKFRGPSALIAAAGAGGLATQVKKSNLSAFGVEH